MEFQRKRAHLAGRAVDYFEGGSGPALVCLHGASGVRITPAVETLAQSRRIFLPIAPGFDGAEMVEEATEMAQLAMHMASFAESVVGGRPDIAGQSFGGWVACWLAVQRPDLVARLILQCPAGFNPKTGDPLEGDPATFLRRAFAHPEKRRPETKTPEMIAANRAQATRYSGGIGYDAPLVSRLKEIISPTMILYGDNDGVVPQEAPLLLQGSIPDSVLVYIEDAAHNIEIDQPEKYVELIARFLRADNLEGKRAFG
jgi:pimeloyl-ACP methyl ester carboxylesterase